MLRQSRDKLETFSTSSYASTTDHRGSNTTQFSACMLHNINKEPPCMKAGRLFAQLTYRRFQASDTSTQSVLTLELNTDVRPDFVA
jgi:hypothetical protein